MQKVTLFLAFALSCVLARAQTTLITASHIQVFGGQAVTGSFCVSPTDANGNAVNLQSALGQLLAPSTAKCFPISAGVLSSTAIVPDTSQTQPVNACYLTTIKDNFGNTLATYPCIQPTGSTWSFDAYSPTTTPSIPALTMPQFQTNNVANALQTVLDLIPGPNVSITYSSGGKVTISSSGGGGGGGTTLGATVYSAITLRPGRTVYLAPNQPIVLD